MGTIRGLEVSLSAVVSAEEDDGIVSDLQFIEQFEELAGMHVVLEHAVGIQADSAFAFPLF